jgi:hypothetical protein
MTSPCLLIEKLIWKMRLTRFAAGSRRPWNAVRTARFPYNVAGRPTSGLYFQLSEDFQR